ncbi:MAG: hypothetical protein QM817_10235 [Archangium sp.]
MNAQELLVKRLAAFRKWHGTAVMPDMPVTSVNRRGFLMVRQLCQRLVLPLPTMELRRRADLSWGDMLTAKLGLVVREHAMGNRTTLRDALVELSAAALAWAEVIEARGL